MGVRERRHLDVRILMDDTSRDVVGFDGEPRRAAMLEPPGPDVDVGLPRQQDVLRPLLETGRPTSGCRGRPGGWGAAAECATIMTSRDAMARIGLSYVTVSGAR